MIEHFNFFQETPTSDFGSNGSFEPSEPSTPGTPVEPFQPRFKVKVTEPVKDGEAVMYTIKTVKVCRYNLFSNHIAFFSHKIVYAT